MSNPAENKSCPYCQAEFLEGENRITCPECGTAHHIDCWENNNTCSVYECDGWSIWDASRDQIAQDQEEILYSPEQLSVPADLPTTKVVTPIPLDHYYCIKCGKEIKQGGMICRSCRKKQPRYFLDNCFGPSVIILGGVIWLMVWIVRTMC